MFVETIKTDGLAHLSYVVGDGIEAAVIDPRRDIVLYEEIAQKHGVAIKHIFETHRNEDLVTGSEDLARRTGAIVLRGTTDEYDVPYAKAVREGTRVKLGEASLTVLETPGHTLDSISIVLRHTETGDSPLGVFTGDALFVNDVGRTDFYPGRDEEVAGLLYGSLHEKLLPLGDQTIIYPAHGAGSVCGQGMANRDFSTIGYEKAHSSRLALSRSDFIKAKTEEHHDKPPYFRKMEEINASTGPGLDLDVRKPAPMGVEDFAHKLESGLIAVDLRMAESFSGGHVLGSLSLPADMLTSFAGWLLPYDKPLGLIAASPEQAERATRDLVLAYLLAIPSAWDREVRDWAIGLRTYPLVAVAACGYTLIGFSVLDSDDAQARIMQGLITGIGFIGGGAILKGRGSVEGTATAASLWATGAIGLSVASHRFEIAILISLMTFLTLRYLKPLMHSSKTSVR